MTLQYITDYIDRKIEENSEKIVFTFYELKIRENLNDIEMMDFINLSKTKLQNMGYNVYETGDEYEDSTGKHVVENNILFIAMKA